MPSGDVASRAHNDEARNHAPRSMQFWAFLGVVTVAGVALVCALVLRLGGRDFTAMGSTFVVLAALLLLCELRPLVTAGAPDANGVSMSTAFVFALLIHWGLAVAVLMQTIATILADTVRQKAPWRTAFNVGQQALSFGAAWAVLWVFHLDASPVAPLTVGGKELVGLVIAGLFYFLVNNALVSQALALRNRTSLPVEFFSNWGYQVAANGALLGLAPIVVIVMDRGPSLVPLILLPLAAVYATAAMSVERERQALHDLLTGLPNRKLLILQATRAIEDAAAEKKKVGLCLLDLDRFKEINDTLGHPVGDALLEMVARRLESTVRHGDIVARLGGDEFAILVRSVDDPHVAVDLAELVRHALSAPFRCEGMSFEIEASIGVSVYPDHGADFEPLLQRADVAMYVAKERSTGVELYSPETDRHSTARLGMLAELRAALDHNELELHYQPKADLRTGDVVGVEALLRWRHAERGYVSPDEFIPLAEQTGLMRQITQFVVDEALRQLSDWWGQGLRIQCAVNVCARDLYDRDFAAFLHARLNHHGMPPRALMVEVTESVLMADPARAASTLLSLADLGVGISLDDFGTGYSSLVHLKRLPVSEVKIDRSFVMRMDLHEDDAAIVRSIIELSTALGLRVVAEGVETREAWDRLAVYGCDAAQGYYLTKAKAAPELWDWLKNRDTAATKPLQSVPDQRHERDSERSALG